MVPEISIIIVSYNVREILRKCLESVFRFTPGNIAIEVIVIDNNSTDSTREMMEGEFPQVLLIRNSTNAGFPAANNQGIGLSRGKYIFLLNPDTELLEDTIGRLKRFLEENDKVSLVAPQLLNTDGSIQKSIFRFPKIMYILAEMFYMEGLTNKNYNEKNLSESFEVDSVSGAAMFFKRSLIENTGMLNEKLFWIEDVDFCYRIRKAGGAIVYFPGTKIIHHSGQSARKNYNVSVSSQIVNKIKFYKVHRSLFSLFIVYIISIVNCVLRLFVFTICSPFKRVFFLKMKAYWYTIPVIFNATKGLEHE